MAAFTSSTHTFASPHSFLTHFSSRGFPSFFCLVNLGKKANLVSLKLNLGRGFEFGEGKKMVSCWSCWCKTEGGSDGDFTLEAEILEFMRNSPKPEAFPSKKELVDAGRMDLVEGIQRQGGWLTMGWDLDDEKDNGFQQNSFQEHVAKNSDLVVKDNKCRNEAFEGRVQSEAERSEDESRGASSLAISSSCSPSSSGRSLEVAAEDGYGIEGILSRLERQRNINLGFGVREKGYKSNDAEEESVLQASMDMTFGDPNRGKLVSSRHGTGLVNDNAVKFSQDQSLAGTHLNNSAWREWSLQRAGFTSKEFEGEEILGIRDKYSELNRRKESYASKKDINHNDIQSRLQDLKSELSSVLHSLRFNVDGVLSQNGDGNSMDNLHKLSDAWEFQGNEIMNAQDKLRSIRTKLAVSEGKMALAIIDTQKILEEKQKRIDDARRALQLLHPACIVWPNSASEVLLAGSFDGWATKRKMEKSSTGVFSVSLKLYPGKYEIKFIVDGEWKMDPLRPIVNNNGFVNNLLIIT